MPQHNVRGLYKQRTAWSRVAQMGMVWNVHKFDANQLKLLEIELSNFVY